METRDAGSMNSGLEGNKGGFQTTKLPIQLGTREPVVPRCVTQVFCHKTTETNSLPYLFDSVSEVFSFDRLGCLIGKYVENQANK